jgi:hypothetical protein
MVDISQAELDKAFAGIREEPPSPAPLPGGPGLRKFSAPGGKEFSGPSLCALTQDELDRLLAAGKS